MSEGASKEPARVDYLDVDPITVPGQNYVLLSVVSPTSNQRSEKCGVKVRGTFGTRQEADAHAKKLQRLDPSFDIFVAEMYRWLLVPPDAMDIDEQEYQEDTLNNLVKGYRENQVQAKHMFEERKRQVLEDGLDKHLLPHERTPLPPGGEASGSGSGETADEPAAEPSAEDAEAERKGKFLAK